MYVFNAVSNSGANSNCRRAQRYRNTHPPSAAERNPNADAGPQHSNENDGTAHSHRRAAGKPTPKS